MEDKIASCESFWDKDGAQFLISTSAGGEGINLQVCRILFNYDLPWNPMAVEQRIGRIHRYGQTETVQVYHLVAEETIEEKVYAILDEKLFEIAMTIGKIDPVTGSVSEDFRSEILGFLGSSTNYTSLYREALLYRNYERTEQEIVEAIQVAKYASEALRQLTQDISTFNLEYYRELEGKFTLENLKRFTEKAILGLGGSFIPSGDIIQITVPPALKKYPDVASRYESGSENPFKLRWGYQCPIQVRWHSSDQLINRTGSAGRTAKIDLDEYISRLESEGKQDRVEKLRKLLRLKLRE